MKGFLYKTYARPVLCYRMENVVMTQKDKEQVKRTLGLSTRLKTTHLLAAVDIEPILSKQVNEKCRFFLNLYKNNLIRHITNELLALEPQTSKRRVPDERD